MLRELQLNKVYSSDRDNLLNDFYIPVLKEAALYCRITGYFSPAVFAVCARGLSEMISKGGKIRIISSIELDKQTFDSLKRSQKLDEGVVNAITIPEDPLELRTKLQKNYYELFVALLMRGDIELKIAITRTGKGILHEKIGIVEDLSGDKLSFSGSNNETVYGWTHNVENFKVFNSWDDSEAKYLSDDVSKFNRYWDNESEDLVVFTVSEAIKKKVFKNIDSNDLEIEEIVRNIRNEENLKHELQGAPPKRELRAYQKEAIKHWEQESYKSIFEMATGSGKTFTSLSALNHFKKEHGYIRCVVVVPLVTLVEQWEKDIRNVIGDLNVIKAASNDPNWRSKARQLAQNSRLGIDEDFIIITTYDTFSSYDFRELIIKYPKNDLVLLADEMHNLVTENNIKSASMDIFKFKLGLSATPTRLWKQQESMVVRKIFGGKSFVYSLENAIVSGALVNYNYHPITVLLTEEEYEDYTNLSKEASRFSHFANDGNSGANPLKTVLQKRANLKKQAANKIFALELLIESLKKEKEFKNTLLYIDSNKTMKAVQDMLTAKHIKTSKFTGSETLDQRTKIIKALERENINAIVAIKCLDEGVDIPSATTGIFLSNNTDPREYIQRLGRVLRRHEPSGKSIAFIYDFIVIPPNASYSDSISRNLVKTEIKRAKFFQQLAFNSTQVKEKINEVLDNFGFYFEDDELDIYNNTKGGIDE